MAQQLPLSSLYTVNKFQINSAYAGFNSCTEGFLSHRRQWIGINGAPVTNYLSLHSGVGKNIGIGANIVLDKTDIISKFNGTFSFAYRVRLGDDHNIRFGLSAGVFQLSASTSSAIVDDPSDEIIQSGNQSSMAFSNEFSVFYNYKKLQIGVSIPQVVETYANFDVNDSPGGFQLTRHIVGFAEYDISLGEKLSFQPSVLFKTAAGKQNQLDLNGQISYKQLFYVGAGYRSSAGLLARIGLNIKDVFTVAYAYEFASNNVNSYSSGSHEIMLGIKLCKKKKSTPEPIVTPEPIIEAEPDTIIEPKVEEVIPEEVVEVKEEVVVPVPAIEEIDATQLELAALNKKYSNSSNMIRYVKNSSYNSISENEKRIINEVSEVLKNNPELKLTVVGYTCDLGPSGFNQKLSAKRAQRIANFIIAKGVPKSQVKVEGKGSQMPIEPNSSEANREENRRVEMAFSK